MAHGLYLGHLDAAPLQRHHNRFGAGLAEGAVISGHGLQLHVLVAGQAVDIAGNPEDTDSWRAACAAWWAAVPDTDQATAPRLLWHTELP